ncbi:MAG: SAM-dependent methyltransferase, partial [Treponemataceae bacterium]|nr:SAM-dependent methyltransferase [Treponemataceae bacterium]
EQKIRKYLVDNNFIEGVISLAPNLFFGTPIAVNILVLSKHKTDGKIQFIDAGELYQKETNNNILTDEHIEKIMETFGTKADIPYFSKLADFEEIVKNEYNLSVSSYVEAKDTRETIDIVKLNAEIAEIVKKENALRIEIDKIVREIEG